MIKTFFKLFMSLFKKRQETAENIANDIRIKTITCIIMCGGALLLTIFNAVNYFGSLNNGTPQDQLSEQLVMLWSTIALTIVFGLSTLMVGVFKMRIFSQILIVLVVASVFSFYGWYGGNDGFAVLWIVIVPLASMLFLNFQLGFFLSLYFVLYCLVVFIIMPKFGFVPGYGRYNSEFIKRFPALYLISFLISLVLSAQRMFYLMKAEENALFDSLTKLKNRRFYADYLESLKDKPLDSDFVVVSADLNNLKVINDVFGHEYGDKAIVGVATVLNKTFGKYSKDIFRTGGDEYFAFFVDKDHKLEEFKTLIPQLCSEIIIQNDPLSFSYGFARAGDYSGSSLEILISIAERNMYADKENYYRTFKGERRRESIARESIKQSQK